MSFWVYILRCGDKSYYTGHTDNLEERLAKHQCGEISGYTAARLPVELLFSQEFPMREEALSCERQIKGWRRSKKEALISGDWSEVSRLAHTSQQAIGLPRDSRSAVVVRQAHHERQIKTIFRPSTSSRRTGYH